MHWYPAALFAAMLVLACDSESGRDSGGDGGSQTDGGSTDGGQADGGAATSLSCVDCHGSEDELVRTVDEDTGNPVQSDSGEG